MTAIPSLALMNSSKISIAVKSPSTVAKPKLIVMKV
ncbi:Uncharacterised protein [Vibrio cholerae]|nr:Uncharacterised protein [Vibrio cholerae]